MDKEKVKTPLADGAVSLLYEIPFRFSWMIILDSSTDLYFWWEQNPVLSHLHWWYVQRDNIKPS